MHANARLTPIGRLTLCLRIEGGTPGGPCGARDGYLDGPRATSGGSASAKRGSKVWWTARAGPIAAPIERAPELEAQIAELRAELKLGPARIGYRLGVAPSTVQRVLVRLGLNRLAWMDRPTGRVIRRYERERPGELIHVDIKKLGKIPDGGGWKVLGRTDGQSRTTTVTEPRRVGYGFIHSAVDDHSRLAYSEILGDERKETAAGFWQRARSWYFEQGIEVEEVLTDNGSCYRSRLFDEALGRDQASKDQALSAPDQRESRTFQPHHARRMGLREALWLRGGTQRRPSTSSCISTIITAATQLSGASPRSVESTTWLGITASSTSRSGSARARPRRTRGPWNPAESSGWRSSARSEWPRRPRCHGRARDRAGPAPDTGSPAGRP